MKFNESLAIYYMCELVDCSNQVQFLEKCIFIIIDASLIVCKLKIMMTPT